MATVVNKTVKSSGGDYSSLSAWEAAQQGNLVSLDELHQAECFGFQDTTKVIIDGSTTDATRYMRVYATSGAEAKMPYNTSTSYRLEATLGGGENTLTLSDPYCHIERIQVKITQASQDGSFSYTAISFTTPNQYILGCSLLGNFTGWGAGTTHAYGIQEGVDIAGSNYIINTVFDGFTYTTLAKSAGFLSINHTSGNGIVYNCTFYNCDTCINDAYTGVIFKNCIFSPAASGTSFTGSANSSADYNSSTTTTSPGTHSRTSQTFSFTSSSDYHLTSGDGGAKDFGTDLSADAKYAFSNDFDGDTRSGSWDIGADEYVSAGGGTRIPHLLTLGAA